MLGECAQARRRAGVPLTPPFTHKGVGRASGQHISASHRLLCQKGVTPHGAGSGPALSPHLPREGGRLRVVAQPASPWGGLRRPDRLQADAHGSQPSPLTARNTLPQEPAHGSDSGRPQQPSEMPTTPGPSASGLRLASGAPRCTRSEGVGNGEHPMGAGGGADSAGTRPGELSQGDPGISHRLPLAAVRHQALAGAQLGCWEVP